MLISPAVKILIAASLIALPLQGVLANDSNASTGNVNFSETLKELRDARQDFRTTRQEVQANHNTNQAGQLAKRTARRKTVLLKLLDLYKKHLENTQARIDRMPNIADAEKTAANGKIEEAITKVQDLIDQVQAATTDEQLKSLAEQARTLWRSYHTLVHDIVQAIHSSRLAALIDKAENRASDLASQLTDLATAGKNVTSLQTELTSAQSTLTEAETLRVGGDLTGALGAVKKAYQTFRQILQGIHDLSA